MAKDDYHVLVYKILRYLYDHLKRDEKVDIDRISAESLNIPQSYWEYIFIHLAEDGYVEGVNVRKALGLEEKQVSLTNMIKISPKGIEYISENSLMTKIKNAIKDFGGLLS